MSQVKNLRAMFENGTEPTNPSDIRGRSPGTCCFFFCFLSSVFVQLAYRSSLSGPSAWNLAWSAKGCCYQRHPPFLCLLPTNPLLSKSYCLCPPIYLSSSTLSIEERQTNLFLLFSFLQELHPQHQTAPDHFPKSELASSRSRKTAESDYNEIQASNTAHRDPE